MKRGVGDEKSDSAALITGASSGIGREFSYALAARFDRLILCGRSADELTFTKINILSAHPSCEVSCFPGDLVDDEYRSYLLEQVSKISLGAVILNAGGGQFKNFLLTDCAEADDEISLNIRATVHLSRQLIPVLLKNSSRAPAGRALLVYISSHAAFLHTPRFSVYASCKSFINSFALTLVQELKREPLDIVLVNPGATRSRFSERAGLPVKMISEPMSASVVVQRTLRAAGRKSFLIVSRFDQLLYIASRLLPTSLFDSAVCLLQNRLLRSELK